MRQRTIVLISCVKKKASQPRPARELYISDLFRKSLKYAQSLSPDAIYILSAKYGLLSLDTVIEPYDVTLKSFWWYCPIFKVLCSCLKKTRTKDFLTPRKHGKTRESTRFLRNSAFSPVLSIPPELP